MSSRRTETLRESLEECAILFTIFNLLYSRYLITLPRRALLCLHLHVLYVSL